MFSKLEKNTLAISCIAVLLTACGAGDSTGTNAGGFAVTSTTPGNGTQSVAVNSKIQVTFSADVDPTSLNAYTFQVMEQEGMSLIEGRIQYNSGTKTATFEPYFPLTGETDLQVTVTNQVRSTSNVHLSAPVVVSLKTETISRVSSFRPEHNETGVNPRSAIRIQFNAELNPATVENNIVLKTSSGAIVPVDMEGDDSTVILKPVTNLLPNTTYTYTVTPAVKNAAGALFYSTDQSKTFTTASVTAFPTTIATSSDEYADSIKIIRNNAGAETLIVAGETWGSLDSDVVEHYDGDGFISAINPTTGAVLHSIQFGSGALKDGDLKIADPIYDMVTIGNDIYVTGFTTGNLSPSDTVAGARKMYLAKYTWNGTAIVRAKDPVIVSAGTAGFEGYAITKFSDGNPSNDAIYVIGTTSGAVQDASNSGGDDIVVAKYKTNLGLEWIKQYGTAAKDIARGVAVDGTSVYIAGETLGDFARPTVAHVGLNAFLLQLNATDGSRGATNFDTTSPTANPSNAFSRVATGVVAGSGKIHLVGTQKNSTGTSTYALTYTAAGGALAYAVDGNATPDDEQATGIYLSPNNEVFVAITRFQSMSGQLHGKTEIKKLASAATEFTLFKTLDAEMHATVRSMVILNSAVERISAS